MHHYLSIVGVCLGLITLCQSQGYNQDQDRYNYNTPPPPQILTHKQALNHDGNFKYLFTSENGLAQGESIAPDGSRNGGYSYVDPTGRKISVKYTAGKEGFRILEADHLPKAPQPIAPVPGHQPAPIAAPPAPHYAHYGAAGGQQDDGSYKPHLYESRQQQPTKLHYTQAIAPRQQNDEVAYKPRTYQREATRPQLIAPSPPKIAIPPPRPAYPPIGLAQSASNTIEEKDYNDEPGKPYSFGNGYVFEFGG
ncbi:unnamed protein product [Acanthoscelides obtectus]|uniref:Uncharacterized protein n=1 Tax=Acanthoscelides obtectus TaxID=200917 RepID=A0A9P0LYH6_ACAOB|nr:unnamed protein product [Acanthoscelides obtectus]CAK1637522.1 hypothetical protein AOBTE_LOCUS10021 [Acanthoscelides obtectus]